MSMKSTSSVMAKPASATSADLQQGLGHPGAALSHIPLATDEATFLDDATNEATTSVITPHSAVAWPSEYEKPESHNATANKSTVVMATPTSVNYRSTAVQTLPPRNAKEFYKIHDRMPTHQEIVSKTGSGAIGRYGPGLLANAHDVVPGTAFLTTIASTKRANYVDSSFQTDDVAKCKKSILRSKVKASLLASRQREAAHSAGFRVWPETRDEYIIHSEQIDVNIQFDEQGNATNANLDGLSLPNIYGEEINPPLIEAESLESSQYGTSYLDAVTAKDVEQYGFSANPEFTPPPTPPTPPLAALRDAIDDVSAPRRIRTVEPHVPSERSDPPSIEDYGYFQLVPRETKQQGIGRAGNQERTQQESAGSEVSEHTAASEQKEATIDLVMTLGGEKFADKYIVYDATARDIIDPPTSPGWHSTTNNKRSFVDEQESQVVMSSPKRLRSSGTHTETLEAESSTGEDHFVQYQDNDVNRVDMNTAEIACMHDSDNMGLAEKYREQSNPPYEAYQNEYQIEEARSSRDSRMRQNYRRRSRSPLDRRPSNTYRSRSRARRPPENSYDDERRRHEAARETGNEPQNLYGIVADAANKRIHSTQHHEDDSSKYSDFSNQSTKFQSRQTDLNGRSVEHDTAEQGEKEQLSHRITNVDEEILERKIEHGRLKEREKRIEEEMLAKRRQLEEAEIQRAREAKNARRAEIEEQKRVQVAAFQQQQDEEDRARRRRRDDSQDRSKGERRKQVSKQTEPTQPVDQYALAREVEARRRESVFAALSSGDTETRAHQRLSTRNEASGRLEVMRPGPDEKAVEPRPKPRPRPSRTARGELERYDPRKKFGRGE